MEVDLTKASELLSDLSMKGHPYAQVFITVVVVACHYCLYLCSLLWEGCITVVVVSNNPSRELILSTRSGLLFFKTHFITVLFLAFLKVSAQNSVPQAYAILGMMCVNITHVLVSYFVLQATCIGMEKV